MSAVQSVFDKILSVIKDGSFNVIQGVPQDKAKQIRYTRGRDFTDDVAEEFMNRDFRTDDIKDLCKARGWNITPDTI